MSEYKEYKCTFFQWICKITKQIIRPFGIIKLHGMAFFLWMSFTMIGGLIGIIVSIFRNTIFGGLRFVEALYIESYNGSLYTYSIAMIAAILSSVFIAFAENNKLRFRRYQIVTITISIFLLFFGGVFYALSIDAPIIEEIQKTEKCHQVNWKQLLIVAITFIVAIYSFCVSRLDDHASQFKDIMDSESRAEFTNDNGAIPKDIQSNE